jgi:hypothetical protein
MIQQSTHPLFSDVLVNLGGNPMNSAAVLLQLVKVITGREQPKLKIYSSSTSNDPVAVILFVSKVRCE